MGQRREEIKAVFKPKWRDLYKRQREELKNFDAGFFDRVGFAFSRKDRSKIGGLLQAITGDGNLRLEFIRDQERARLELGQAHKTRITEASREIREAWEYRKEMLAASHAAEDDRAYEQTKAKSDEIWKRQDVTTSEQDFDKSADRRKDHTGRKKFGDKIRGTAAEDEIKKARSTERTRTRRQRKRRPRGRGVTPD